MSNQIYRFRLWWLTSCRVTNLRICRLEISARFLVSNLIWDRDWIGLSSMFTNDFLVYFLAELSVLMIELGRYPRMRKSKSITHLRCSQTLLKTSRWTFRWITLRWLRANKGVGSLMIPQNVRSYRSLVLQKMWWSLKIEIDITIIMLAYLNLQLLKTLCSFMTVNCILWQMSLKKCFISCLKLLHVR